MEREYSDSNVSQKAQFWNQKISEEQSKANEFNEFKANQNEKQKEKIKKQENRKKAINELIDTEKTYVNRLCKCIQCYVIPLKPDFLMFCFVYILFNFFFCFTWCILRCEIAVFFLCNEE